MGLTALQYKEQAEAELQFKNLLINNNLDVKIGSLYKYNSSNVNHIRKDHIVKNETSMSAYCSEKKQVQGYVRNLIAKGNYSFHSNSLCVNCVKKYLNDTSAE